MKNLFIVLTPSFISINRMNAIEGETFNSKEDICNALETKGVNVDIMTLQEFKTACNKGKLDLSYMWWSYVSIEN